MPRTINGIATRVELITREAQDVFGALTAPQLHWKPAPERWSVAECLGHLIVANRLYFPELEALASDRYRHSLWQRISPFTGFWGPMLIKSLDPSNRRKTRTMAKMQPVVDGDDPDVMNRFVAHQVELAALVRRLPPNTDLDAVTLGSPLTGLITYSLRDCLEVIVMHEKRHVEQARQVMDVPGFPGA